MAPHPRQETTVRRAQSLAWWSTIIEDAKKYYRDCVHCLTGRMSLSAVGVGTVASVVNAVVQIDDKPVPKELRPHTDYVSVLTVVELATGDTMYLARRTESAAEVAILLVTRWIVRKGIMQILQSDNASELVGLVVQALCAIYGIPDRIVSAVGHHCSHVERANAVIAGTMRAAAKMGDVQCNTDFELYVAFAETVQTQVNVSDDTTIFERVNGVKPITTADLVLASDAGRKDVVAALLSEMDKNDAKVMKAVADRCDELVGLHRLGSEKRARYNMANRTKKECARTVTDYGIEKGEVVSYLGHKWTVVEVSEAREKQPAKLLLQKGDGSVEKYWVATYLVRPLATQRVQNVLPAGVSVKALGEVGATVLYATEVGGHYAIGKVLDKGKMGVLMHEYDPKKGVGTTFMPLWRRGREKPMRRAEQPAGHKPETAMIQESDIAATVELDKAWKLKLASESYVKTLGFKI